MGGSIHIHGTGSSIVDTVFVCRDRGNTSRAWLFEDADGLADILDKELVELRSAGMKPTAGDIRCMAFGHVTRMAVWKLRPSWDATLPAGQKLAIVRAAMDALATVEQVSGRLERIKVGHAGLIGGLFAREEDGEVADAVAF